MEDGVDEWKEEEQCGMMLSRLSIEFKMKAMESLFRGKNKGET